MSKIDDLIAKLCPNGVEYKTIEEVCSTVSAGGDLPENYEKGQLVPTDKFPYPIYSNGSNENALYGFTNTYRIDKDAVTVSARGTIGYHAVRKKFFTPIVRLITLLPNNRIITAEYLNYALDITEIGHSGGSIPQLTVPNIKKVCIPVPPLEIQREIVKVLDTFTKLEAELEAELEARRRQYHYYRDQLLNFEGRDDVQWMTLGEVAINQDSKRRPVTKSARNKGEIPYYGASGIVDYVSDYIFDGDFLLVSEDGANLIARSTPIAFSISGKTWVNNHAHVLQFNSYTERKLIEIYLNSIDLTPYISGGAQPKLNQANLNKIPIPVPPLEEQTRIVAILDKFDALVNDLSSGLPAEISARRKQYEYYRDRLLTFKEAQ